MFHIAGRQYSFTSGSQARTDTDNGGSEGKAVTENTQQKGEAIIEHDILNETEK